MKAPSRQHGTPLLIGSDGAIPLRPLGLSGGDEQVSEAEIQALVHAHPEVLPIAEVDSLFAGAVSICTELNTAAGPIDNLLVTPSGLPVLVECKLWRNPEGRREVVGQILDYAKELSRWSSSDLQREVNRRLGGEGNALLDRLRAVDPAIDEIVFNDALTANLRRGRFLLLIVGDGIREGVEAISEYLERHAGLHFSLGLIEMPVFVLPDERKLVVPRILARTHVITRTVIAVPQGHRLEVSSDQDSDVKEADPERMALAVEQQAFWTTFLGILHLDDPEQAIPKPARQGYLAFMLPAKGGSSWLTVYRDMKLGEVGLFLSSSRNSPGEFAMQAVVGAWDEIKNDLDGKAQVIERNGRTTVAENLKIGPLDRPEVQAQAFGWLAERVNVFINVLRPRVRSAAADYPNRT